MGLLRFLDFLEGKVKEVLIADAPIVFQSPCVEILHAVNVLEVALAHIVAHIIIVKVTPMYEIGFVALLTYGIGDSEEGMCLPATDERAAYDRREARHH